MKRGMKTSWNRLLLCAVAAWGVNLAAARAQVQVETLELQQPIPSWGRLGGLSVDQLGFLYISNFGESVWRVKPDGEVTLLVGTGQSGHQDGAEDVATLSHPNGIVSADGGRTLFTNTILGQWRKTAPAQLQIRRIRLR